MKSTLSQLMSCQRFHELKDGEEGLEMHQKTSAWPLKVHGVVENGGSQWLLVCS